MVRPFAQVVISWRIMARQGALGVPRVLFARGVGPGESAATGLLAARLAGLLAGLRFSALPAVGGVALLTFAGIGLLLLAGLSGLAALLVDVVLVGHVAIIDAVFRFIGHDHFSCGSGRVLKVTGTWLT